jgi:endonuclease/exonuclease/phosphatase family metal-dependent hydrolase
MNIKLLYGVLLIPLLFGNCEKVDPIEFESEHDLSVMSFNLRTEYGNDGKNHWDNRKEAIVKMFNNLTPDIFGVQEAESGMLDYLQTNLPHYNTISMGRDYENTGESNAIFYNRDKYELLNSNTFWLSETPNEVSRGWDAVCNRIVTWAHLKDLETDKTFYFFNTHFDHKGKRAQKESGKLLLSKIEAITNMDESIFISGDFNVLIRDKALQPIIDNFYEARRFANQTDNIKSFNFFGKYPLTRNIDFIFYKSARALSFRTVSEDYGVPYISDHYPIIAHFKFENQN